VADRIGNYSFADFTLVKQGLQEFLALQRINQVNFSGGSVPTENLDSSSFQAGAQHRSKRKVPKIICSTRIKASERRKQAWIGTNF